MDLTDPMVLANAMIFHDAMNQQMTQTIQSTLSQPSSYPSFCQGTRFDRNGVYYDGVCTDYIFSIPIKDFKDMLSNPITLETTEGREYMKMVMGRMKGLLLVSIFFQSPKVSSMETIKMTIMERVREFKKDEEDVVIVVDGKRSEEFNEGFLKQLSCKYQKIHSKIIIKKDF